MLPKLFLSAMLMALFLCPGSSRAAGAGDYPDPQRVFRWDRDERLLGFRNVEKLTGTHRVAAGGPVRELKAASSEKGRRLAELLAPATAEFMKTGDIVGVLVIHDGEIVVEEYAHGLTPQERWTSFSVAKSFTSTLAGAAIKDGKMALDDQVVKFIPELKNTAYDGVRIRHLLTMTSGVEWNEDYSDPDSDTARLALGAGDGGRDQLTDLAGLRRVARPGSEFSYKTGETNVLGLAVSRAVGLPLADYLSKKIWRPYGMEADGYWAVDGQGRELAGCCLSLTLRDYARFGLFILEGGQAGGAEVLPKDWLREATRDQSKNKYGYQWRVVDKDIFAATGIFGQMIAIDRGTNSLAVILSAWEGPLSQKGNQARFGYLFQIRNLALKRAKAQK